MNGKLVDDIAAAILYEGYLLYPYRASAIKNKQRWTFGVLYPRAYAEQQSGSDAWVMQTECLVRALPEAKPQVRVRFLHLIAKTLDGQAWQGAMEREIAFPPVSLSGMKTRPVERVVFSGVANQRAIEASVETEAEQLDNGVFKIRISIRNSTPFTGVTRDEALMQSLVSTHTILGIDQGEFVSLLEPPEELHEAVAGCTNSGTWPVLVGEEGERDAMLSSPIILYDYPRIALESPGALFDGTEIDEILTLRILTLTDEEKLEMSRTDERTRQILERTESMSPEEFMKLHGGLRALNDSPRGTS